MRGAAGLGGLWKTIQAWLFPVLEDELGELHEKHREFVAVCEICAPQTCLSAYCWIGNGCPPKNRLALFKAFVAKAIWNFATTRGLISGDGGGAVADTATGRATLEVGSAGLPETGGI